LAATVREWLNDDTFRFAAALAFYTIFSLAPERLVISPKTLVTTLPVLIG
jgi:uncharacterized BrkB/YihY/UPF0761 family membrane protein